MASLKDTAVNVMVVLIFLNAAPNLVIASGVGEDLGIQPTVSDGGAIDNANSQLRTIQPSGGFGSTLYGLYTSMGGTMQTVLNIVAGGWIMLVSIGVPVWLTDFVFAPQYLFIGATMIYVLAGRLL